MKALFVAYPHIGLAKGGMRVQIDRTAQALRDLGVEVIYYDPWTNQVDDCDVCHLFSAHPSVAPHGTRAAARGKAVVWSPVLSVFGSSAAQTVLEARLGGRIPGFMGNWRILRELSRRVGGAIALTRQEQQRLSSALPALRGKLRVIPNGVDKMFAEGDANLFRRKFSLGDYVLNVAFIGPVKNQLNLIRAMKGSPMKLVLIGQPLSGEQSGYLEECQREAGDNVLFAGTFPYGSDLLLSAYAGAKVFALPSTSEVMTISLMEAALAGCRLVASSQVPIIDCLQGYVATPSPHKPAAIRAAIDAAAAGDTPSARDVMLAQPDWPEVGRQILELYKELLARR